MIKPTSFSERLLFTTVRIHTWRGGGEEGTGTGFFFNFRVDDKVTAPTIVTNNHVVAGATRGRFFVHEGHDGTPTDMSLPVIVDEFEQKWIPHPDPAIDLCAMPCGFLHDRFREALFNFSFDGSVIPTDQQVNQLGAIESVVMAGYPNGLRDDKHNLPLIRRGITASHPAVDFQGRPEMVVDMACIPGSSGSPVLILDEGLHVNKKGLFVGAAGRSMLLGVLYGGPVMTQRGEIVSEPVPTHLQPGAYTQLMLHLGYVIEAREILRLGEHVVTVLRR